MNARGLLGSQQIMGLHGVMLVALCISVTILPANTAPVPEEDSLLNDLTSSSGDSVDTGPTIPLDKEIIKEEEFEVLNKVQSTKPTIVYSTMTPRRFTTALTTLPPIPPHTSYPTIPPRTTMRKEDIHIIHLDTTLKAIISAEESSDKVPQTHPSTISFTTVPVPERVDEVKIELSSSKEPEPTPPSSPPPSTTEEDGPILVGVGDSESKSTIATSAPQTKTSTKPSSTTVEDGAIIVEMGAEETEKVVLPSTTTEPSTTKVSTKTSGIIVDVAVEVESQASTLPTKRVTLPPVLTTAVATEKPTERPTTQRTEAPELEETSKPSSTVQVEVIQPVIVTRPGEDSKTTTSSTSTSTTSVTMRTTVGKTTEDKGLLVVPVDKDSAGEENKLAKNETSKIPHSPKSDMESPLSTEATSPVVLKSEPAKDIKYGVLSDLVTDKPLSPEEEIINVNATLIHAEEEGGLSYAARTGIAMGCIVGFWIIIGPLVCLICKLRDKKRDKKEKEECEAREKASSTLVEEMVKAELQKTPNGDKKKMYENDKFDDGEIEPITIGDADSMPYMDADANSRDTAL